MPTRLTISDVKKAYQLLKQKAFVEYKAQQYAEAWQTMKDATGPAIELNWEYSDDELEQLLQLLAWQWIPEKSKVESRESIDDSHVVVLDDWCTSYVLVLQYIDALVDAGKEVPFDVKRIYYLDDVPGGADRGRHAHKALYQLIVAASGAFTVELDDGTNKKAFTLNRPYQGLLIKPGIWRTLTDFSSGSICMGISK